MKLKRVEIDNFNSYRSCVVQVRDGLFNIWGLNGQGKTSIQLAIRLGLGWSPAEESLEDAIHENEEQCRIALVFDNSDNTLKRYPEEIRIERRIIRGDAKPRMRISNQNGELVPKTQKEIREEFSKLGYDPDDPGIFIEQGDLRSFYAVSFSKLLEKCIGLAGLRGTYENVKHTERTFYQIEENKREIQKTISDMDEDLERYRLGHDAYMKFCEFDEELKNIEFENKAIQYHNKRIESLKAKENMEEIKETLEEHKRKWGLCKKIVENAQEKIFKFTNEQNGLEQQRGNIKENLDRIYNDRNRKSEKQKELGELILLLNDPALPPSEIAKIQVDNIQQKLSFSHSKLGKQQEELRIIKSQLADIKSGLALGVVPFRQKTLKQRLINAGIKVEFFADCLEIKKGAENLREKIETLLDPFKYYLVIQKKDLQKGIEILKGETEVSIIVPDDWSLNNYAEQSAKDYLIIKDNAPDNLQNFLTYFILNSSNEYGPNEKVFLDPSIRFHRVHLSAYPQNKSPAIGEEGRRIARESAERQKNFLENSIRELDSEIKQIEQDLLKAKEIFDLTEKKRHITEYKKELDMLQKDIYELNKEQEDVLSKNRDIDRKIGELNKGIEGENLRIQAEDLSNIEKAVKNYDLHYQNAKRNFNELNEETEFIKRDTNPEYIDKLDEFMESGLNKRSRENYKRESVIKKSSVELENKFTRGRAEADYHVFLSQKSLIEEKRGAFRKQQEQASQFKVEWDKAQHTYKKMASELFNRASLIFREIYKRQDANADALITPNFNATPPELEVKINLGKRKKMVSLNSDIGGPSGGERLAAIVNMIVSILKARSQLAKAEPDLYRPQPFIFIDEPQQDMDDPAFINAILNFKEVMEETQIIILTHKALPDPELWQLWVFLHPELGTIGKSHRGEIHKLDDKHAS